MNRRWQTASAEETIAVGVEIASLVAAPSLVLLEGALGAGKTTLMKGVISALGGADAEQVTSPTFTLVHEFSGERDGRAVRVFHLDLYRLETERELLPLGLDEMFDAPDALVFVEWGGKFPSLVQRADAVLLLASEDGKHSVVLEV